MTAEETIIEISSVAARFRDSLTTSGTDKYEAAEAAVAVILAAAATITLALGWSKEAFRESASKVFVHIETQRHRKN